MTIGQYLRSLRIERGYSTTNSREWSGVPQTTWSRYERDKTLPPPDAWAALGVPPPWEEPELCRALTWSRQQLARAFKILWSAGLLQTEIADRLTTTQATVSRLARRAA